MDRIDGRLLPDLSLTLGLRYDFDVFPSADDVRVIGKLHPTNYGNVQPRVGLAYALNGGKQVVRARVRSLYRTMGLQRPDGRLARRVCIHIDE